MMLLEQLASLSRPVVQTCIVAACGMTFLFRRHYLRAAGLLLAAALWLGLCSTPAFASWMQGRLQMPYTRVPPSSFARADAIVVLGGGRLPSPKGAWALPPATRLGYGLQLFRMSRAPVILLSGKDQALTMRQRLLEQGVPPEALLVDADSDNTHQNAVYSASILKRANRQRVLLVTSGMHMPRAAASFSREGLTVIPAPLLEDAAQWPTGTIERWRPNRHALRISGHCLREYLGFWCYRLAGWV